MGLLLAACVGTIGDTEPTKTAKKAPPVHPPIPLHRLNRLEYDNTVRDLLGMQLRSALAFPPDGESEGFDNIAEALQLTPSLLSWPASTWPPRPYSRSPAESSSSCASPMGTLDLRRHPL